MTNLSCNACSCVHNDDNCCCLNGIDVKGSNACECSETCCGSYSYKDGSAKNNTASPKPVSYTHPTLPTTTSV